jgi:hypothetical protein
MEIDLSEFFKTKMQANDFSGRIGAISQAIYQTGFNLEELLLEQFGLQKKDKFIMLLQENKISATSPTDLKTFFDAIQEKISTLPILSMTLGFEPKEKTLQSLSEWFFLNIKKQVLFDISVDHALIGGAIISFNGKQKDFSVKPKFDKVIAEALANNNQLPAPGSNEPPPLSGTKHLGADTMHLGR